jgi:hypothetical protein
MEGALVQHFEAAFIIATSGQSFGSVVYCLRSPLALWFPEDKFVSVICAHSTEEFLMFEIF